MTTVALTQSLGDRISKMYLELAHSEKTRIAQFCVAFIYA